MTENITKKIKVRLAFAIIFLILAAVFLVVAILVGIANADDIINTSAIVSGIVCGIFTTLSVVFFIKFRNLRKASQVQLASEN